MTYRLLPKKIKFFQNPKLLDALIIGLTTFLFFLISGGNFLNIIWVNTETINFLFTLWMVWSSWWIFKRMNQRLFALNQNRLVTITISVLALSGYALFANWFYIEKLWFESLMDTPFFDRVFPMAIGTFTFWNFVLFDFKRASANLTEQTQSTPKNTPPLNHLVTNLGKKTILLKVEEIACFYIDQKYVYALTFDFQKYVLDQSLNFLENQLDRSLFFRINRQVLIARKAVNGFKSDKNQKIIVDFIGKKINQNSGVVSRYKAPEFKAWLKSEIATIEHSI